MSRIRLLPEALVNRIAAGEVVERPAACVKELVENALDAGATRIHVVLQAGGTARIEVSDDGHGMDADDLVLAVQRHATSKLADEGLVRIATLGFRGEALPSIGAVARLSLTSRRHGAPHASEIRVEGSRVEPPRPAAAPPGTRAVVADLFWATPARRKFLKSPRAEAEQAEAALRRLALAAPRVAFRCDSDGKEVLVLPAQDRAERAAALLGPDVAGALLAVEGERDGMRVSGFAAQPAVTRATAAGLHLVVNGRPVTDPVLRTAVRVAYRDVIAGGRHPVAALFLDVPAEAVDVNVHPAKTELRFRDAAAVRSLVIGAVGRALSGGGGTDAPRPAFQWAPSRHALPRAGLGAVAPHPGEYGLAEATLPLAASPRARPLAVLPGAESEAGDPPVPGAAPGRPPLPQGPGDHPLGAAVAQVLDTYVLAVSADGGLVLVDQHAAAERLAHEALRAEHVAGGVRAQALLVPAVVELPPHDAARLLERAPALARLGLELESFGPGTVLVRTVPALLGAPDPAPLLRDLADELAEGGEATALDALLDAALARMACHGSLRAGRRLSQAEMDGLLRRMEATPRAATCSHGRPTFLKLTRGDLERMFGRR